MEQPERHEEPDLLHYYCSSSTLLSIVKNRALWLTALTLSNDGMEGRWAINRYLDLFKREDRRASIGAKSILEHAVDARVALGICLSREQDLLSQWRGYAAGGRGICISFRVSHLKTAVERLRKDLPKLSLAKVDYPAFLDPATVKAIHEEFGPQIDQAQQGGEGDFISMSKDYGNGGHDRETLMVGRFFALKNPAFSEEREWRLILVDYPSSIPNLKFRESNSLIPTAR